MTQKEIGKIVRLHQKWLESKKGGVRADFSEADLSGTNLCGMYLCGADLSGAELSGTDLYAADLSAVDFFRANLSGADLSKANLREANLRKSDLSGADLSGANLYEADLSGAKNVPYIPMICPEEGQFTGWKKVNGNRIIKLLVPEDALRSSATTRKCRCSKAQVLDITDLGGNEHFMEVVNESYNRRTLYKVGEMVYPDSFDTDRWKECSNGIHFFMNRQEGMDY